MGLAKWVPANYQKIFGRVPGQSFTPASSRRFLKSDAKGDDLLGQFGFPQHVS
jgi:hypothetical protein